MIELLQLPERGLMRLANLRESGGWVRPETSAVVAAGLE